MKKIYIALFFAFYTLAILFYTPAVSLARSSGEITDWYIKDFQSEIIVNKDSSLDITEKIIADCGNLPDKHGIFRTLPKITKTPNDKFKTPIELVSITDFNDRPINYQKQSNSDTITWKIGDANKTVHGVNEYKIKYHVKNVIRTKNPQFDELYWNLSGNFWQIDVDHFEAKIILPDEINKTNVELWSYSGPREAKDDAYSTHQWIDEHTITFESKKVLKPGDGITASITFPKNILIPYKATFYESYGQYLWLLLPIFILLLCFLLWKKYGDDPNINKAITPEFDPPENLSPVKMGMLFHNGGYLPNFTAATIINLAVKKAIKIEELKKTIWSGKNYRFTLLDKNVQSLDWHEKSWLSILFPGPKEENSIELADLKKDTQLYKKVVELQKGIKEELYSEKLMVKLSNVLSGFLLGAGIGCFFFSIFTSAWKVTPYLFASVISSGIIFIIFAILMPKRTLAGAELVWKIKGFKLFIETAKKYRAPFDEKENIFEDYLPYAIMFGLTKQWINAVSDIKGSEYFSTYHPVWYTGGNVGQFDVDSFSSAMTSISSSIGSSGAGGAGGSGGGGGGGGGGGW